MNEIQTKVARLMREGTAYQGAMYDLTDVLRWARERLGAEAGMTHWEDCWRVHLPCAIEKIEGLAKQARRADEERRITYGVVRGATTELAGLIRELNGRGIE